MIHLGSNTRQDVTALALFRPDCLGVRALGGFLRAEFRDVLDERHRNGLGEWEADGAALELMRSGFIFEGFDKAPAGGINRVVPFEAGEEEHPFTAKLIGWDVVGDHFFSAGQGLANQLRTCFSTCCPAWGCASMYSSTDLKRILAVFSLPQSPSLSLPPAGNTVCFGAGMGMLPLRSRQRIRFRATLSAASAWEKSMRADALAPGPFGGFVW